MTEIPDARPESVRLAVFLQSLGLAIGFVQTTFTVYKSLAPDYLILTAFILVGVFAFSAFVIYKIWARRNWARILQLVMLLVGLFMSIPMISAKYDTSPLSAAFSFVLLTIQLYSMYLLFTPPSNTWFSARPARI